MFQVTSYFLLAVFFSATTASAQIGDRSILDLRLTSDSIRVDLDNPILLLNIEAKNAGSENIILYNFGTNILQNVPIEDLCDVNQVGAGICVFLTHQNGNRIYINDYIPDTIMHDPFSNIGAYPTQKKSANDANRPVVLEGGGTHDLPVKFKFPELPEGLHGQYYLQLVYYSGVGIYDKWVVGDQQIQLDKKMWDAFPFQGCSSTNTIKLFFE
jgi:hypothetical protein